MFWSSASARHISTHPTASQIICTLAARPRPTMTENREILIRGGGGGNIALETSNPIVPSFFSSVLFSGVTTHKSPSGLAKHLLDPENLHENPTSSEVFPFASFAFSLVCSVDPPQLIACLQVEAPFFFFVSSLSLLLTQSVWYRICVTQGGTQVSLTSLFQIIRHKNKDTGLKWLHSPFWSSGEAAIACRDYLSACCGPISRPKSRRINQVKPEPRPAGRSFQPPTTCFLCLACSP